MNGSSASTISADARNPSVLGILMWTAFVAVTPLDLRLVYEQTVLTWRDGPQMIGFAMAHLHPGLLILGMVLILSSYLALAAFVLRVVINAIRGGARTPKGDWVSCAALGVGLAVPYVPYSTGSM